MDNTQINVESATSSDDANISKDVERIEDENTAEHEDNSDSDGDIVDKRIPHSPANANVYSPHKQISLNATDVPSGSQSPIITYPYHGNMSQIGGTSIPQTETTTSVSNSNNFDSTLR